MSTLDNAEWTFDTSSLIELFRHFPRDIFVSIWDLIERLFTENRLVIIKDVVDELSRVEDEAFKFVNERKENVIELTKEVQLTLRSIIQRFPNWISPYDGKNAADPCLVAIGKTYNIKVISEETIKGNQLKIPYICNILNVECGNFFDFLRDNNVRL